MSKNDSSSKLSHKDIQVFARQLVSVTITECLEAGCFDQDLLKFNEENQQRIVKQLRLIAKQMDNSDGKALPSEKQEKGG